MKHAPDYFQQNSRLFNGEQARVLDSARAVLAEGIAKVHGRVSLFPAHRDSSEAKLAREAREALTMLIQMRIGALPHEQAVAALFDAQGRLAELKDFPEGELSECSMSYRTLAGWIVRFGAAQVLIAHNHPSGDCTPSVQDQRATIALENWLLPMGCFLTDQLVVTVNDWCSIKGNWTC